VEAAHALEISPGLGGGVGPGLGPVNRSARRDRVSDRVHAELVEAIRELRLTPGAVISEHDLTAALGVSRTPVREALARLADSGLVTVVPQVGTRVAAIRMSEVREAQFVRENLELAVLGELCANTDADLSTALRVLPRQQEAMLRGDTDEFFATDERFHAALFAASGHARSWELLRPLKVHLDRVRRVSIPRATALSEVFDEHVAIADAVNRGDVTEARRVATTHVRRVLAYAPTLAADHPDWVVD